MIPMVSVGLGFLIAAALAVLMLQAQVNSDHQSIMGESLSNGLAMQFNIKEREIKTELARLADSDLVGEAVTGNNAVVADTELKLMQLIPHADRVRIFGLNEATIDRSAFPPFNYTTNDLVIKAQSGETPPAEAISSDNSWVGDKWVVIATPIRTKGGDTVRGTLLVYYQMTLLTEAIGGTVDGGLELIQRIGATPRSIATMGSGGSTVVITKELENPNWVINYSPSPGLADSSPGNILFYVLPALIMLVVSLVGVVVGSGKTASLIQKNLSQLGNQIARIAAGTYDAEASYSLPGFGDQDSKLKQLINLKAPPPKAGIPLKAAKLAAAPAAGEGMVDIEMVDDDTFEEVAELDPGDLESAEEEAAPAEQGANISAVQQIFRAYDIRGVVGESLNADIAQQIGLAIGSEADARGEQTVLVGYDGRNSSPELAEALIEGLTTSGRDVINVGAVPTPVLYYATHNSDAQSGVMITGSHNASDYNGFKVVMAGKTLVDEEIQALFTRIMENNFTTGEGSLTDINISQDYLDAIADDVVVAQPLKVAVDCGNGIAGGVATELLDALGCEAVPLYCEVDGSFPNHHPDPTKPENLEDLVLTVQSQEADLGIALDGDGDRLVAVTGEGDIVWPDRLLMLFAKDVVSRNPGSDVVYDVKCTRHLNSVISGFGGRPIISRSGHSFVKQKMAETDAMLGGEMSGHICFSERWYGFDDGLYSAARLLEIVGSQEDSLSDLLQEFPVSLSTPEIHVSVDDADKFDLVDQLIDAADFEDASFTTIDGLRVDFSDGWGLVRASNTEPALTLRFEADDQETLDEIKGAFRELLQEVREDLDFS